MIQNHWRHLAALSLAALLLSACGKQPVEEAVAKNDRAAVKTALAEGGDVNAKTSEGDTPLLLAVKTTQSSSSQGLI